MLINILLSLFLYSIFGWIGIYIIKNKKNLKSFCNKKNLITVSIIYVLGISILFSGDPDASNRLDQILLATGNFGATYIGALIATKILIKKKSIFSSEFYHALLGAITGGSILLFLAYGF